LHGLDHGFVLEPPLALIPKVMLADIEIDASIEGGAMGFGLLPEALGKPGRTLGPLMGLIPTGAL
jgi:hypothetical protein